MEYTGWLQNCGRAFVQPQSSPSKAGIVAGAVLLVLTGIILCYKAYIATG